MPLKIKTICSALLVAIIVMLFALPVWAQRYVSPGNVLIAPNSVDSTGLRHEALEQLNEKEFLLTYSFVMDANVQALGRRHTVTLLGTNYTYPDVTGYRLINGSFFTKQAQDQKLRHIVLNSTAAFNLFGSMDVTGNTIKWNGGIFSVVGVIEDNDEDQSYAYLPISFLGKEPNTILAVIDEKKSITDYYIQNELSKLGLSDEDNTLISFDYLVNGLWQKAWGAVGLFALTLLLLFIRMCLLRARVEYGKLRLALKQEYLHNIIKENALSFVWVSLICLLLIADVAAIFYICLKLMEFIIGRNNASDMLSGYYAGSFSNITLFLKNLNIYSDIGFVVFFAMLTGFILQIFIPRARLKNAQSE